MKKNSGILISVILLIFFLLSGNSIAGVSRMIGPNITMSWASSYLTIESGSVSIQQNASWSYATAIGWFFDYQFTPYVSLRTNWFFYPTCLNSNPKDFRDTIGQIPLHEMGFSILRHLNAGEFKPWVGAGPFVQFATPGDVNSYIVHVILSTGFNYEISEGTFFCPELMGGVGARIISRGTDKNVQINVPTGRSFSSSGFIMFFKLGVGKAF